MDNIDKTHSSLDDSKNSIKTVNSVRSVRTKTQKIRHTIFMIVESWYFITLTTIVTLWALFGDDIRQLCTDSNGDNTFYIIMLVCFGVFVVEIILASIGVPDYFLGFYFWLDIISTLTVLLDIAWI